MSLSEQEWQTLPFPIPMLEFLGKEASPRKLRLFACACCRAVHALCRDGRTEFPAVELAEKIADGRATTINEEKARNLSPHWERAVLEDVALTAARWTAVRAAHHAGRHFAESLLQEVDEYKPPACVASGNEVQREQMAAQANILREIFGNPFRIVYIDPHWLSVDVVDLARAIYDDRAFDRMPILADALMDAGCDSEEVLGHYRVAEGHVRGCWLIDLLLGKA